VPGAGYLGSICDGRKLKNLFGGGVDSTPAGEDAGTLHKAEMLLRALKNPFLGGKHDGSAGR
jgi:hypothetical protein